MPNADNDGDGETVSRRSGGTWSYTSASSYCRQRCAGYANPDV